MRSGLESRTVRDPTWSSTAGDWSGAIPHSSAPRDTSSGRTLPTAGPAERASSLLRGLDVGGRRVLGPAHVVAGVRDGGIEIVEQVLVMAERVEHADGPEELDVT